MNKQTRSPIFISFYTEGNYEKIANEHLLPTLKRWSLPFNVEKVINQCNWYKNSAYKATFILEMLKKHKKDVVFIDCDAKIQEFPVLFYEIPEEIDIACHILDLWMFWHNRTDRAKFDLLSGTMLFSYNQKVLDFTKEYAKRCKQETNPFDQKILQEIVEKDKELKLYNLPASYCVITKEDGTVPEYIGNPVIQHYQASRTERNRR